MLQGVLPSNQLVDAQPNSAGHADRSAHRLFYVPGAPVPGVHVHTEASGWQAGVAAVAPLSNGGRQGAAVLFVCRSGGARTVAGASLFYDEDAETVVAVVQAESGAGTGSGTD